MDPRDIAHSLSDDIEAGRIPPGTTLKQEALADRFGVSRQPVRQALTALLARGLVERLPDRSLAVRPLAPDEHEQIMAIRQLLEREALTGALPALGGRDLLLARRLVEDGELAETAAELEEIDAAFHRVLYAPCGNARLVALIDELRREGRRAYAQQPRGSASRQVMEQDHTAILAACAAGRLGEALAALANHLRRSAVLRADTNEVAEA